MITNKKRRQKKDTKKAQIRTKIQPKHREKENTSAAASSLPRYNLIQSCQRQSLIAVLVKNNIK